MGMNTLPGVRMEEIEYPYRDADKAEEYRSVMSTIIQLMEWMEKLDELPVMNDKRKELQTAMNHLLMEMTGKFMKEAQKPKMDPFRTTLGGHWVGTTGAPLTIQNPPSTTVTNWLGNTSTNTLTFDPTFYMGSATNTTIDPGHMHEIKALTQSIREDGEEEGR